MTDSWNDARPQSAWFNFKQIPISSDWFQAYEIATNLFVFYEPRHYEQTLVNLIIGQDRAALIDTGCGIGRALASAPSRARSSRTASSSNDPTNQQAMRLTSHDPLIHRP